MNVCIAKEEGAFALKENTETFENKFGDAIKFKNSYAEALERFSIVRWIAYTIAFSGWGVAAALIINNIFK